VSLGKTFSDVKLIHKILRSLPDRFRIMVTTTEESKDLEEMEIEDVSFFIGCILLTKSLLYNVVAFTGMPYISESSDIQSLFLLCGKSRIMTSCKCHKLREGYFSVQGRFCVDSNSEKSNPKQPSGRCVIPPGRFSVSNIRPNDENLLSGHPAVSYR
jgi:hypothetical protein